MGDKERQSNDGKVRYSFRSKKKKSLPGPEGTSGSSPQRDTTDDSLVTQSSEPDVTRDTGEILSTEDIKPTKRSKGVMKRLFEKITKKKSKSHDERNKSPCNSGEDIQESPGHVPNAVILREGRQPCVIANPRPCSSDLVLERQTTPKSLVRFHPVRHTTQLTRPDEGCHKPTCERRTVSLREPCRPHGWPASLTQTRHSSHGYPQSNTPQHHPKHSPHHHSPHQHSPVEHHSRLLRHPQLQTLCHHHAQSTQSPSRASPACRRCFHGNNEKLQSPARVALPSSAPNHQRNSVVRSPQKEVSPARQELLIVANRSPTVQSPTRPSEPDNQDIYGFEEAEGAPTTAETSSQKERERIGETYGAVDQPTSPAVTPGSDASTVPASLPIGPISFPASRLSYPSDIFPTAPPSNPATVIHYHLTIQNCDGLEINVDGSTSPRQVRASRPKTVYSADGRRLKRLSWIEVPNRPINIDADDVIDSITTNESSLSPPDIIEEEMLEDSPASGDELFLSEEGERLLAGREQIIVAAEPSDYISPDADNLSPTDTLRLIRASPYGTPDHEPSITPASTPLDSIYTSDNSLVDSDTLQLVQASPYVDSDSSSMAGTPVREIRHRTLTRRRERDVRDDVTIPTVSVRSLCERFEDAVNNNKPTSNACNVGTRRRTQSKSSGHAEQKGEEKSEMTSRAISTISTVDEGVQTDTLRAEPCFKCHTESTQKGTSKNSTKLPQAEAGQCPSPVVKPEAEQCPSPVVKRHSSCQTAMDDFQTPLTPTVSPTKDKPMNRVAPNIRRVEASVVHAQVAQRLDRLAMTPTDRGQTTPAITTSVAASRPQNLIGATASPSRRSPSRRYPWSANSSPGGSSHRRESQESRSSRYADDHESVQEKLTRIRYSLIRVPGVLILGIRRGKIVVTLSPDRRTAHDIRRFMRDHDVRRDEYECAFLSPGLQEAALAYDQIWSNMSHRLGLVR